MKSKACLHVDLQVFECSGTEISMQNDVIIAVNICTYRRMQQVHKNLEKICHSAFFDKKAEGYYGRLHVFITDNAGEWEESENTFIHIRRNPAGNTGGSGGFQCGIVSIRAYPIKFSHVLFMDDDVEFELESFYILFEFLRFAEKESRERPIAGRMFCADAPEIQYTAAEVWNGGDIRHIGFRKNIEEVEKEPAVEYCAGADYGGWWFCCFPYSFVAENDIMPFFIHCDDVEYGLRCEKKPIILKGVQVWHKTYEYRQNPIIHYYDTRNPLFVNEKYALLPEPQKMLESWKRKITRFHMKGDYASEYYAIKGMEDFLKGVNWLYAIDPERKHKRLQKAQIHKYINAILWRVTERKLRKKYHIL